MDLRLVSPALPISDEEREEWWERLRSIYVTEVIEQELADAEMALKPKFWAPVISEQETKRTIQ